MFADHGCRSMKFFNYFVKGVLGYPTGAPRCDVKKPGHGHQVREAPFRKVDRVYGYCPNSFDPPQSNGTVMGHFFGPYFCPFFLALPK